MNYRSFLILRKVYKHESVAYPHENKNIQFLLRSRYLHPERVINKDSNNPIWWKNTGCYSISHEGTKALFDYKNHLYTRTLAVLGLAISLVSLICSIAL